MSILDEICARKRADLEDKKARLPLEKLLEMVPDNRPALGFVDRLKTHQQPAIIAEVKKASPSAGVIREDFDPVRIAQIYEENGAACISVLTDTPYFQGEDIFLEKIKMHTDIPVLRKDFIVDAYQVYESRLLDADCILLIMACLTDAQAAEFYDIATTLGMDVLVEAHDEEELERALKLNPKMIGINNRNLKDMTVDIQTSLALGAHIPDHIVKISESGLRDYETLKNLNDKGFHGFLIGESLTRQEDIGGALTRLRGV